MKRGLVLLGLSATALNDKLFSKAVRCADFGRVVFRMEQAEGKVTAQVDAEGACRPLRPDNSYVVYGYNAAQALVEVLKQCRDDLTRANIMRQAEALNGAHLDMLLPDIALTTSPSDHDPIERMQLRRFDGRNWVRFGSGVEGTLDKK